MRLGTLTLLTPQRFRRTPPSHRPAMQPAYGRGNVLKLFYRAMCAVRTTALQRRATRRARALPPPHLPATAPLPPPAWRFRGLLQPLSRTYIPSRRRTCASLLSTAGEHSLAGAPRRPFSTIASYTAPCAGWRLERRRRVNQDSALKRGARHHTASVEGRMGTVHMGVARYLPPTLSAVV